MVRYLNCILLTFLFSCTFVHSSYGDQHPEFLGCVKTCISTRCENEVGLDLLPFWNCEDDCKYTCMHETLHIFTHPVQFYGKWPFTRVFFVQEFASVVFSLANLYAHWHGFNRLRRELAGISSSSKFALMFHSCVSMNAWVWSSIFHTRDVAITEHLDYFSAIAVVLCTLWLSLTKVLSIRGRNPVKLKRSTNALLFVATAIYFLLHIRHTTRNPMRFDYDFNMKALGAIGLSTNILWFYYFSRLHSLRHVQKLVVLVLWVMMAMTLEVFDFSPWFLLVDAHALWHAATVIPAFMWYDFLIGDEQWRGQKYEAVTKIHFG